MLYALRAFVPIKWRHFTVAEVSDRRSIFGLAHQAPGNLIRRDPFLGCAINFHSIACGEQLGFSAPRISQNTVGLGVAAKTLARFHVGRVMTQSNTEKIHGMEDICAAKVIPQRSVKAALKPTMHRAATRFGAIRRRC